MAQNIAKLIQLLDPNVTQKCKKKLARNINYVAECRATWKLLADGCSYVLHAALRFKLFK
jgi:hypothetical protein